MLLRILSYTPLPLLYALAWVANQVLFHISRYRKPVVEQNLAFAFPGLSMREKQFLMRAFYRSFAEVAVEIIKARRLASSEYRQRVKITNPELLADICASTNGPVLLLTIHQGNWEWMLHGIAIALNRGLDPVYKPLHNHFADRFAIEVRSRFGCQPIALDHAGKHLIGLRRQQRVVAMIADQAPVPNERQHCVDFFDRPTAFHAGPVALARALQTPLVFAQCQRQTKGVYRVHFHMLAKRPHLCAERELVARYAKLAEASIRAQPETWLWTNRRWKRSTAH
ncbi:MAG: lysophospholipid acyltransferase family protein [Pseudomonadota bacterium]